MPNHREPERSSAIDLTAELKRLPYPAVLRYEEKRSGFPSIRLLTAWGPIQRTPRLSSKTDGDSSASGLSELPGSGW